MDTANTNLIHESIAIPAATALTDNDHAVSWGAVLAGATGAAALSLILLILGVGLGLSSVSPWSSSGVSATTIGVSTIVWLSFVQVAASGMGGYLAGRLRARWRGVRGDETYFRDTAHGFLAWCVATLVTATMLASAVGNIVGGATQASATAAGGLVGAASSVVATTGVASGVGKSVSDLNVSSGLDYWVDSMFRRPTVIDNAATTASGTASAPTATMTREEGMASTAEAARILATSVTNGSLSVQDSAYLAQMVSQRTGMSQADAKTRVAQIFNDLQAKLQAAKESAQKAADATRKASAYASLWLFISLLMGAFVASLAATFGGRQRDI